MKKLLILVALSFVLVRPADAQVIPGTMTTPAMFDSSLMTASAGQIAAVMGTGIFAAWVFPYLNTTGEKPFEEAFGPEGQNVFYQYPHDVSQFPVTYSHVQYEIPNSAKYPYMDENGMHYPVQVHRNGV